MNKQGESMKILLLLIISIPHAFASNCTKINDSLDRDYCFKKELRTITQGHKKMLSKYKKGISKSEKNKRLKAIKMNLKNKQDLHKQLSKEIEAEEAYKKKFAKLSIKRAKKKKKKKDNFFKKLKKIKFKL
jgi:hypothetical protein